MLRVRHDDRVWWGKNSTGKDQRRARTTAFPGCEERIAKGLSWEQAECVYRPEESERTRTWGSLLRRLSSHPKFEHPLLHTLHKGCKRTTHIPHPATAMPSWPMYCFLNWGFLCKNLDFCYSLKNWSLAALNLYSCTKVVDLSTQFPPFPITWHSACLTVYMPAWSL